MSFAPQAHILYLHGFLSSPMSAKAQQMRTYLAQHFPHVQMHSPQLSGVPSEAVEQASQRFSALQNAYGERFLGVIGSSMGGFLTTHLLENISAPNYKPKGVLINPAVAPHILFPNYLGEHINPYTKQAFTLSDTDVHAIKALYMPTIQRTDQYQVWLETEDEVLDYRLAETLYADSDLRITQGGDHSFQGFSNALPNICAFLACERFAQ
ncbi:MAG: YqiA/YcfP family alpha/beta fold hydrolase [Glaciecola sp.]|jgi:uncharacterized protein|uniref:YqiA/YcfP family alpha/beta fold hydrolase n=1 Tax=Glaciecola sp. HTCC2999 TaxID=455436 RepID=UPI0000E0E428|nr:YqiA/YcfP family alpha/beta fold hydrolase [Glaciecola sp. HTCC2999]